MKITPLVHQINQDIQRLSQIVAIATNDTELEKLVLPACAQKTTDVWRRCKEILHDLGDPTRLLAELAEVERKAAALPGTIDAWARDKETLEGELTKLQDRLKGQEADALAALVAVENRAATAQHASEQAAVRIAELEAAVVAGDELGIGYAKHVAELEAELAKLRAPAAEEEPEVAAEEAPKRRTKNGLVAAVG